MQGPPGQLHTVLKVLLCSLNELKSGQLEATLLEPSDDLSNEVTLDAIGLRAMETSDGRLDN